MSTIGDELEHRSNLWIERRTIFTEGVQSLLHDVVEREVPARGHLSMDDRVSEVRNERDAAVVPKFVVLEETRQSFLNPHGMSLATGIHVGPMQSMGVLVPHAAPDVPGDEQSPVVPIGPRRPIRIVEAEIPAKHRGLVALCRHDHRAPFGYRGIEQRRTLVVGLPLEHGSQLDARASRKSAREVDLEFLDRFDVIVVAETIAKRFGLGSAVSGLHAAPRLEYGLEDLMGPHGPQGGIESHGVEVAEPAAYRGQQRGARIVASTEKGEGTGASVVELRMVGPSFDRPIEQTKRDLRAVVGEGPDHIPFEEIPFEKVPLLGLSLRLTRRGRLRRGLAESARTRQPVGQDEGQDESPQRDENRRRVHELMLALASRVASLRARPPGPVPRPRRPRCGARRWRSPGSSPAAL